MTSRRSFLGTVAGGLAAGSALRANAFAADPTKKPPLGFQLWSVREQLQKDVPGTLKQIKAWGIDEVETAGFAGLTAEKFATELKNAGLRCHAMHIGYDLLQKSLPAVAQGRGHSGRDHHRQPLPAAQGSALRHARRDPGGGEGVRGLRSSCKAAGKRFAYHTHGQEFDKAPEGTLFDVLAKESGPDVGFEFDVFWIVWGGADPVALMNKYAGRVWYTHLKDMAKGVTPGNPAQRNADANAVLGTGQIDVKGIVAAGTEGRRRDPLPRGREQGPDRGHPPERRLLPVAVAGAREATARAGKPGRGWTAARLSYVR